MNAFSKIIGYDSIKAELMQLSDVLANPEPYSKLGVSAPKGLLIFGDPGLGKTLMANCLIEASGRQSFICRKDVSNSSGGFIIKINDTFQQAINATPSIILLDDMDKFTNGDEDHPDSEEYVTVQACIDKLKASDADVFVLATVNNLRVLPKSLVRCGRFDRRIEVKSPTQKDSVAILKHYVETKKFDPTIDMEAVASMITNQSGALLETISNEAGLYAGFDRSELITLEHFTKAVLHTINDVPFGLLLNNPDLTEELNDPTSEMTHAIYHEAGHVTVSEALVPDGITLATIYGEAGTSGGFTNHNYKTIRDYSANQSYISMCVDLAGRAVIEQKFGHVDLGASYDLNKVFHTAHHLIVDACVSGFSYRGDVYYRPSETLYSRQELAIIAEVERMYRITKEILALNNDFLEGVAYALAKKGILTAADIAQIKQEHPVKAYTL